MLLLVLIQSKFVKHVVMVVMIQSKLVNQVLIIVLIVGAIPDRSNQRL